MESGCDCSCDYDDVEHSSVEHVNIRKAIKPHICGECNHVINKGESYEDMNGLWEGEWLRFKTCIPCVRLRSDLCGGCFVYGNLHDVVWDCLGINIITDEMKDD